MYVCVCLAVTEAEVQASIEGGATTRDAVTKTCRAGGDCGACHGMIEHLIEEHLDMVACGERPGITDCPPAASSAEQLLPETSLTSRLRKTAA